MGHLEPETGNHSDSIQLNKHSQSKEDCNKIFKSTGPQKHPEESCQCEERCDSSHKNIYNFAVKMGKKKINGTEEKICRDIVGSPQEPEKKPLP